MPAATPRLYSKTLFQHEVFTIILSLNAGSLSLRHVNHVFLIFLTKGHKTVEILALLTAELSSSELCKVGICILMSISI